MGEQSLMKFTSNQQHNERPRRQRKSAIIFYFIEKLRKYNDIGLFSIVMHFRAF